MSRRVNPPSMARPIIAMPVTSIFIAAKSSFSFRKILRLAGDTERCRSASFQLAIK